MSDRRTPSRRRSRSVAVLALASALLGAVLAGPVGTASAHGLNLNGITTSFSCRASVANLLGLEPIVANRPSVPCRSEDKAVVFQKFANPNNPAQFVQVEAAHAKTQSLVNGATAHAEAAKVVLTDGTNTVLVEGARADAAVSCHVVGFHGTPQFRGSSTVATLNLGGRQFALPPGNSHQEFNLGPLGVVHVNERERFAAGGREFLRIRAVWWERPDPELDVIVGEAIVDVAGCQ